MCSLVAIVVATTHRDQAVLLNLVDEVDESGFGKQLHEQYPQKGIERDEDVVHGFQARLVVGTFPLLVCDCRDAADDLEREQRKDDNGRHHYTSFTEYDVCIHGLVVFIHGDQRLFEQEKKVKHHQQQDGTEMEDANHSVPEHVVVTALKIDRRRVGEDARACLGPHITTTVDGSHRNQIGCDIGHVARVVIKEMEIVVVCPQRRRKSDVYRVCGASEFGILQLHLDS